jgi:hypothetical protein
MGDDTCKANCHGCLDQPDMPERPQLVGGLGRAPPGVIGDLLAGLWIYNNGGTGPCLYPHFCLTAGGTAPAVAMCAVNHLQEQVQ